MGCQLSVIYNVQLPYLKILVSHEGLLTYWYRTWVEIPVRKSVLKDPRFQDIMGIGKKVPGVGTEKAFNEEVQPLVDIVKNGWFKLREKIKGGEKYQLPFLPPI